MLFHGPVAPSELTRLGAAWNHPLIVFPANLHMAMNPELFPDVSTALLYARLPLQLVFIVWAWWATRPARAAIAQPAWAAQRHSPATRRTPSR